MAKKTFKIIVPKPAAANELGTDTKLYVADELVEAKEDWQQDVMNTFVENGWAMEVKAETGAEETSVVRLLRRSLLLKRLLKRELLRRKVLNL